MFLGGLIIGLLVGVIVGLLILALLSASKSNEYEVSLLNKEIEINHLSLENAKLKQKSEPYMIKVADLPGDN